MKIKTYKNNKMKRIGVIIKHLYRDSDYRIDIYDVPEDLTQDKLYDYVMSQMLGTFEIIGMTDRISFDCKIK